MSEEAAAEDAGRRKKLVTGQKHEAGEGPGSEKVMENRKNWGQADLGTSSFKQTFCFSA